MIYKFSTFQEASQFSAGFCVANKCSARVQRDGDQWSVETDEPTPSVSKTSAVPKGRKVVMPPPAQESKKVNVVNTPNAVRKEALISRESEQVKQLGSGAQRMPPIENTKKGYLSDALLLKILQEADVEERLALSKVVSDNTTEALNPQQLQSMICAAGGNRIMNAVRGGIGVPYGELLLDACTSLKVEKRLSYLAALDNGLTPYAVDRQVSTSGSRLTLEKRNAFIAEYVDRHESALLSKLLVEIYGKMTPDQQAKINKEIEAMVGNGGQKGVKGLAGPAAFLVLGNLGGFATYTVLSSALSLVSLGSLGFGAYTMASSLLSVALGPVGWIGLGLYGAVKLGAPDKQRVVQLAATCAMIRQRLKASR